MKRKIQDYVKELEPKLINFRRDFHRNAEVGFLEFRTASIVVKELRELGYDVIFGEPLFVEESMMGVPSIEVIEEAQRKAIAEGADADIVSKMAKGKTGVVGILDTGRPGPTIGFRVDMDALNIDEETSDENHRPVREGFSSINPGAMHSCGHDAHTAIGLGLGYVISKFADDFNGKIKLLFQTCEEGARGAKSMAESGIVDDVDYMIGIHVGLSQDKLGQIICGTDVNGFPASHKFDVFYTGKPAHAGGAPEKGNNALLAAASAILNLHSISRHSGGMTRVNVGSIVTNDGRNIIPFEAKLKVETRGANTEIDNYMYERAQKILSLSAEMYDVKMSTNMVGQCITAKPDKELSEIVGQVARTIPEFTEVQDFGPFGNGAGEDYTFFMERVQKNGGQATCIVLGTELSSGHHTKYFDINEEIIPMGVQLLSEVAYNISTRK